MDVPSQQEAQSLHPESLDNIRDARPGLSMFHCVDRVLHDYLCVWPPFFLSFFLPTRDGPVMEARCRVKVHCRPVCAARGGNVLLVHGNSPSSRKAREKSQRMQIDNGDLFSRR
jgi:hypothetical protein